MQTITFRSVSATSVRREGPSRRLSDAEFQAGREKGFVFDVMRGTPPTIVVRATTNRS